jgi:hypothetical protein
MRGVVLRAAALGPKCRGLPVPLCIESETEESAVWQGLRISAVLNRQVFFSAQRQHAEDSSVYALNPIAANRRAIGRSTDLIDAALRAVKRENREVAAPRLHHELGTLAIGESLRARVKLWSGWTMGTPARVDFLRQTWLFALTEFNRSAVKANAILTRTSLTRTRYIIHTLVINI